METFNFNFQNRGGINQIYAISWGAVRYLRQNYRTKAWQLKLYNNIPLGSHVIQIPVIALGFAFNEQRIDDESGIHYEQTISGTIPKCSLENTALLKCLEMGRWLVLSSDNNGYLRLSGDKDCLMHFTSNSSSGSNTVELNATQFEFSAQTPEPAKYIERFLLSDITGE